ncbi:MAG: tetratricopeptide repeat protein [Myxococcota bacterium]
MEPSTLVVLFGSTALAALFALVMVLSRKGRSEDEARAYLAGFTYVLSDDPDAAIAELSRAAQLNRQTLETYFALGALFRRNGELERAIRLHRNMLLRPGLSAEVRRKAQLELALDYKKSGLQDLAAQTFHKLLSEDPSHKDALLHLRRLNETAGEWAEAMKLQARLCKLDGKGDEVLAHLLAAAARSHLASSPVEAAKLAERAVAVWHDSADAQLSLAECRLAQGRPADAAGPLRRALALEPELAPRYVPSLAAALGDAAQVEQFLQDQVKARDDEGAPFELALALHDEAQGRADRAVDRLRSLVERHPRLWEARKQLGALLLAQDRSEELRADYREILGTLGQPPLGFACVGCRQSLPEHLFRCPSCETWGSVRRQRSA